MSKVHNFIQIVASMCRLLLHIDDANRNMTKGHYAMGAFSIIGAAATALLAMLLMWQSLGGKTDGER